MKIIDFFKKLGKARMDKTELAILRISMLIAALDGDVSKAEIDEFRRLAEGCEGYSKEETDKAFVDTLRSAGYLMLVARVAERESLLDSFVLEAEKLLPVLADFGSGGVQGAVGVWKEMAAADGDFAEVEQKAIERLEELLEARNRAQACAAGMGMCDGGAFAI